MKYVIGIDLGTSAVKVLLMDQEGRVSNEVTQSYPLYQAKSGYSEQDPNEWVEKTILALSQLIVEFDGHVSAIEGISFSGQMHGLVLLNKEGQVLRNAILWNDTRTTEQCREIVDLVGEQRLLEIAKNPALEGFTLPKLLWVKEHEKEAFEETDIFMLPKDYLRFKMTGKIHTDYSDAAGTLMMDITAKKWSEEILEAVGIDSKICPPLTASHMCIGTVTEEFAKATGLAKETKVFAGGADNACGAIGAGILSEGKTLCSIGTSGVILSYEKRGNCDFQGKVHFFNHGQEDAFYTMGVTLAAGYSLSWFKDVFADGETFGMLLEGLEKVPLGANGLLFTPYLSGERTPHADARIRASFIGMDASHSRIDFARAVVEGITFSLNESVEILRKSGKDIKSIISIGGGTKNNTWLQIQADIFNAEVIKPASEQGPAIGAAMLAALGCGWFKDLEECAEVFVAKGKSYLPIPENVERYQHLYRLYKKIYLQTRQLNAELSHFRNR